MEQFHVPVLGNLIGSALRHSVGLDVIGNIPIDSQVLDLGLGIRWPECCDPSLLQPPPIIGEINGAFRLGDVEYIKSIGRQTLAKICILSSTVNHECIYSQNSLSAAKSFGGIIDDRLLRAGRAANNDKECPNQPCSSFHVTPLFLMDQQ